MDALQKLLQRAEALVARLERLLPDEPAPIDWSARAYRWRRRDSTGTLEAVHHPHTIRLEDLQGIDAQKQKLERNTRQFLAGLPANNALLTGARGTGKSSLIKALLNDFADDGLRLVEVDRQELIDLPQIVAHLADRPGRFILFCDDLSFEADDPGFKSLKVVLDGSLSAPSDNILIYATSNRRHLLPESLAENRDARAVDGEIHPAEAVDEKLALSDRFGLWLSFYPFNQEEYLNIVYYWLVRLGAEPFEHEAVRAQAVRWALGRGVRSGRIAWQFARDWAGRTGLEQVQANLPQE